MTAPILFDIETRADKAVDVPEFWKLQDIKAPSNWKDPLKIADYIEEEQAKVRNRMALSPVTGVIVCAGVKVYGEGEATVFQAKTTDRAGERVVLQKLAQWLDEEWDEKAPFITYNGRSFDMPFVAGRAAVQEMRLRVPARRDYQRHVDIFDDVFGREGSQGMWQFAMGGGMKEVSGKDLLTIPLDELSVHCVADLKWLEAIAARTELIWRHKR